jgi:hypothetical protein
MNSRHSALVVIIALPLCLISCKGSTEPLIPRFVAQQVPGCSASLNKTVIGDSCFSYQFHDALTMEFCMTGNCCPDSNRFSFRHSLIQDTILIVVSDTAAHLCRCTCNYLLRAEVNNLERDDYLVLCVREDYPSQYIFYSVRVRLS